ncbi:MAG: cytochrome c-type biogenesis protein CcmH [Mycobacteriales bacterium]
MSRRRLGAALLLAVALAVAGLGLARAASPDRPPTLQERVDAVAATIRCPTCQGLSISDSPSVLADGSRQIVEQQLREGRTPDEVRQYFVDRYGPSAVLSPTPAGAGLLAWLLPAVALPLGGWLGWRRLRRRSLPAAEGEPDPDAAVALESFLSDALQPDGTPAGEALREALLVRVAAEEDGLDAGARSRADARLGAAHRRYTRRPAAGGRAARSLPRRAVTVLTVLALLAGTGAALAVGVRTRGAGDLPTGDLPGAAAAPGLSQLVAATRERPKDPQGWVALGRAYDASGELAEALRAYDQALTLRPRADDVQLLRASILVRGGSVGEALPVLTDLAARHPDDPDTLLVLGNAQDILGRPEADATLRRFLELAPDAPAAAVVRERLAQP